jgi:hypothetical protein
MPTNGDRWKNRRKMAWAALLSGLWYPILILATDNPQLGAVAGPFYIFVGAVVGAYIGFATVDDKWKHDYEADSGTNSGYDDPSSKRWVGSQRVATEYQDQQHEGGTRHGANQG